MYVPVERALRFNGLGTASSRDPFPSLRQLSESDELTVEMAVRPARIYSHGVPSILALVSERGEPALMIGAWKKSLVLRLGRPANTGWKKYQEIGVADVFSAGQIVRLVISLGPGGTTVSVNGNVVKLSPDATLDAAAAPLGRLLLSNSVTGGSTWKGDILELAIHAGGATPVEPAGEGSTGPSHKDGLVARYRFDQFHNNLIPNDAGPQYDLIVPPYFAPLRRTVLEPPRAGSGQRRWLLKDIVLNIAGFVPFGLVLMLVLGTRSVIAPRRLATVAVSLGFSFSLVIELTQALLPTRSSSLTDLAMNTLGTAAGVLLFFILYPWQPEAAEQEAAIF